ncbi:hypothetical protein BS78_09G159800 [Paspalum vaginatum]|nr:hypothetical protein BS78_09G159800 [Paspalum vaginatum]
MSSLPGGCAGRRRGGGGRFELDHELPRQQPPVVVDVGCNCRAPRLLASLVSSLRSRARAGRPTKSPHASSSSWSSSTATAFTPSPSATTTATTASSLEHRWSSSWGPGPATYGAANGANALYEVRDADADAERARRRQAMRRRRQRERRRSRCGREVEQQAREEAAAVAVEVESAAPYEDFRESMVAMVTEKEMYAWEDLNALLHQFLSLNSPRHHPLILTAFADLWAPRGGLFCPPSPCLL